MVNVLKNVTIDGKVTDLVAEDGKIRAIGKCERSGEDGFQGGEVSLCGGGDSAGHCYNQCKRKPQIGNCIWRATRNSFQRGVF